VRELLNPLGAHVTTSPTSPPISAAEQLEALGRAVITTTPDGTVVAWNPAAERMYGWTAEEAIGCNIADLCVPEIAQDRAADIMAALRAGVPWAGGFPVRRKNGTLFPALVSDAGIYRDGELVGIVGVSANLGTALRPLLERSSDAALVLRSDGVVAYASPAVTQLFGWKPEELVGVPIMPLMHPDDRRALADFLPRVVTEPGAHPALELRLACNGDWIWAEAALTNLLDDPEVRGVVCNLRPSLRRAAQEEAETRARQLQVALDTRLIIEQAKGYLAGHDGTDPEVAFQRIRQYARSHHQALHDVATRVVRGELELDL
jgi:PAS domain S-box-containing protein